MNDPLRPDAVEKSPPGAGTAPGETTSRRKWISFFNPLNIFGLEEEHTPLAEAQRLLRDGQFGQASLKFRGILEQTPDDPAALRGLSSILLRKGGRQNLTEALDRMEKALVATPDDPANYLLTTLIYSRMGRPYEAGMERKKMAVARTLQKNPDNAAANNSMGVILLRLARHDAAIGCFRKAVAANPRYDQAHRNLAKTFFVMARREGEGARRSELIQSAKQEVERALQISTSAASLITEARVLVLLGDMATAEQRLAQAEKLEPHHPELIECWRMINKAAG